MILYALIKKSHGIEEETKKLSARFHAYYENKMKENIRLKVCQPKNTQNLEKNWTNNNSESLNHILKVLIDWKSKPLHEFVNIIEDYAEAQFKDVKRCIVGLGQYKLAKSHIHFQISKAVWASKTEAESARLYGRFRNFVEKDPSLITSTDGTTTVHAPRAHGKKIRRRRGKLMSGQRL
jgi:hypothetical protein